MSATLPRDALAAAFPAETCAGGFRLPALTLQHVFALTAIESPILDEAATSVTLRDMATAIALLVADPKELSPIIADALYPGEKSQEAKAQIRRMAIETSAKIPIESLAQAFGALQRQIAEAWRSFVPMAAEDAAHPLPDRTGGQSAAAPASGPGLSS